MDNKELDKLEALAKAAEQMFTGMHWYTRFQILDGISNDESAAFIGALDPDTVLKLIALARAGLAAPTGQQAEPVASCSTCKGRGYTDPGDSETGATKFDYPCPDCPAPVSAAPTAPTAPIGNAQGFALWFSREDWGIVTDGVMLEIERSEKRKQANSESVSDARAEAGRAILAAINARSPLAAPTAAQKEGASEQDAWISVEERLPEGECLAVYVTPNGKQRLIRAKYAHQFQIEAQGDDCETEYNEADDTFYIKAGWLECIDNWGEYSSCYVVEGTVTHWKPSPALPAISAAQAQPKDTTDTKEKA